MPPDAEICIRGRPFFKPDCVNKGAGYSCRWQPRPVSQTGKQRTTVKNAAALSHNRRTISPGWKFHPGLSGIYMDTIFHAHHTSMAAMTVLTALEYF